MEQTNNEILYRMATAVILDLLVKGEITQNEFELIDEKNKESFSVN